MAPKGRPKGTKNASNHKAGGARRNCGRLSNAEKLARDRNNSIPSITNHFLSMRQSNNNINSPANNTPNEVTESTQAIQLPTTNHEAHLEEKKAEVAKILKSIEASYRVCREINNLDNDDSDSNNEDSFGDETVDSKKAYQPKKGSTLYSHLEKIKKEFVKKKKKGSSYPQWHPLLCEPVILSSTDPDDWYLSNTWCYIWDPFIQYGDYGIDSKTVFTCKRCGACGNLNAKEYKIRPAMQLDKITWIIYRQFVFPECKTTSMELILISYLNYLLWLKKDSLFYLLEVKA